MPRPHIALVGLMGTGKSTVGELVAAALLLPLVDGDAVLEERTGGRDAATIADEEGIEALHQVEATIALEVLACDHAVVFGPAASVIEEDRCRDALAGRAFTVWLTGDPEVIARRAADGEHRPFAGDPLAEVRAQAERRDDLFASVADLVIDVSVRDAPAVAARIVDALRR